MNKQQLASKIWESANKMRSKIEANEYKDYILGFIFYKYLSDTEVKFLQENEFSTDDIKALVEDDKDNVYFIQQGIGYFIAHENLFSTWIEKGRDFDVSNVRDALSAFSRLINTTHKKVFEKILMTLETGLSKLGDSAGTMNLVMRGIIPSNIVTRNADTLEDDWPYFDDSDPVRTYNPLFVDAVVSNPPYSQNWDSSNKESDPRYARFGLAPKTKADFAFLLHDLYHLNMMEL
ncbi:MAG: hypothetical protein Ta2B_13320 [Termitinemataceae bacterium]|nr:MAG: hypothetical protein Ta2B_13320 [Termitinemataceae bacterium]